MPALVDLLDRACSLAPHADALIGESRQLSYTAFERDADLIMRALRRNALTQDEPILVMVSNQPEDLVAFYGVWRAGGVVVPVHRSSPDSVVAGYATATGARLLIDVLAPLDVRTPFIRDGLLFVLPGRRSPAHRPLLADAALIIFTSGSTGAPKGAVLSHRAVAGKLAANDSYLRFGANERTLLVLNITFSFGVWVSLLTLARGGTLVLHERFRPATFLEALGTQRIDRVAVVPTMMRVLRATLDMPDQAARLARLTHENTLRQMMIGGEFLPAALGDDLCRCFPRADLIDIYGLTETATSDFVLMPGERARFGGCIGRAAPGVEFRIAAAPGEAAGELQIRTPFIMSGYLDAPELTAGAFADGYFRTGDLARLRADGVVELVGRAKEIINRAGAKISPLELEQVFARHPAVAAALATGVADPVLGERTHVLIVPAPEAPVTESELRAFALRELEHFKQPDAYHFANELPLGRTGKADRGVLRARIEASPATTVIRSDATP